MSGTSKQPEKTPVKRMKIVKFSDLTEEEQSVIDDSSKLRKLDSSVNLTLYLINEYQANLKATAGFQSVLTGMYE